MITKQVVKLLNVYKVYEVYMLLDVVILYDFCIRVIKLTWFCTLFYSNILLNELTDFRMRK